VRENERKRCRRMKLFSAQNDAMAAGLTRRGTPVVHTEALSSKLDGADWIDKKCPVCLAEWAEKETEP